MRLPLLAILILSVELSTVVVDAYGATPVARISSNVDETSIIEPGDPLEFKADSLTDEERCKWKVLPAFTKTGKPTYKVTLDELKRPTELTLFSRQATYNLTLYVWNDEDMVYVERTIVIGQSLTPIPNPTPPLNPQPPTAPQPPAEPQPTPLGLDKIVKDSVKKNVPASERDVALKLADAYKEGAKNLANGTWTVEEVISKQRDLNTKIPGYKSEVWRPVFKDLADALAAARDANKFNTQKQYVAAWAEISLAFFGAAGE